MYFEFCVFRCSRRRCDHFDTIEFAIFSGKGDSPNYRAFNEILGANMK